MINIKYIKDKYGFYFKSNLGQNFFNNDMLLEEIVNSLQISKDDIVLEIGPGFGVLTEKLLNRAKNVTSVEIDSNAVFILNEEFKNYNNFELINEDFLKMDLKEFEKYNSIKIIANIPYYITTPILEKLFKSKLNINYIAFMLQEEVGNRILAKPNSKEYGSLTVFSQYYSKPSLIKHLPASNFTPKPKVDSVFIKLEVNETRSFKNPEIEKEFLTFVKMCFGRRRKNLYNVLTQFNMSKEELRELSKEINIDFNKRPENLEILEFQQIFINIWEKNEGKKI